MRFNAHAFILREIDAGLDVRKLRDVLQAVCSKIRTLRKDDVIKFGALMGNLKTERDRQVAKY